MSYLLAIVLVILAYLIGSLSTAIITCKLLGKEDPRTVGSRNPGATNVLRVAGKKAAIITLLGDSLKGLVPVLIGQMLQLDWFWLVGIGIAAFLGHLYPLFYGFKGGKGVATAMGVYLGLSPLGGLLVILTWLAIAVIANISSLSALIATLLAPFYFYYLTDSISLFFGLLLMTIIIYWRHRSNIRNLLAGTEGKIRDK